MSIIIDLIIVGILALCIFLGYKKGLTKCIIKILSFIIALVVAVVLFKPISNLVIQHTKIDDNIKETIISIVGNDIKEDGKVKEETNLPLAMVNYINKTVEEAVEGAKNSVIEVVAQNIAITTINVGVAILLFVLVRIALIFVSALSKIITDLPIIKQFDKAGGIIYGLLKAFVIIFVAFAIISFISPLVEQTGIMIAINKSFIGSILYNNNILLNILL